MSAVNFKVGDIVKVREDLIARQSYGGWNFNSDMYNDRGKVFKISKVKDDPKWGANYRFENYEVWGWTDEMLEPAITPADNEYKSREICSDEDVIYETSVDDLLSLYSI